MTTHCMTPTEIALLMAQAVYNAPSTLTNPFMSPSFSPMLGSSPTSGGLPPTGQASGPSTASATSGSKSPSQAASSQLPKVRTQKPKVVCKSCGTLGHATARSKKCVNNQVNQAAAAPPGNDSEDEAPVLHEEEDDVGVPVDNDMSFLRWKSIEPGVLDEGKGFGDAVPEWKGGVCGGVGFGNANEPVEWVWGKTFGSAAIELTIRETIHYARFTCSKEGMKWVVPSGDRPGLTEKRFQLFCGVFLFMCLVPLPELRDYWSRGDLGQAWVKDSGMTNAEFEAILHSLHFVDSDKVLPEQRAKDKSWKIRPLVEALNDSWRAHINPPQQISLDEKRCRCKAHSANFKYNKEKPIKRGFEMVSLACPCCGYEIMAEPTSGAQSEVATDAESKGATEAVVFNMMRGFGGKNHVVVVDSYYCGVPLAARLRGLGVYMLGTVRSNRKGLPPGMGKADNKGYDRGTLHVQTTEVQTKDAEGKSCAAPLFAEGWMDTKWVTTLSSIEPKASTVTKRVKDKKNNKWSHQAIACSTTTLMYNKWMGGCDLGDQLMSYYLRHMPNRRPYVILFFHFFLVSALNGRAMFNHKNCTKNTRNKEMRVKAWYSSLMNGLKVQGNAPDTPVPVRPSRKARPLNDTSSDSSDEDEEHLKAWRLGTWMKKPASYRMDGFHNPVKVFKGSRGRCILCLGTRAGKYHPKETPAERKKRESKVRRSAEHKNSLMFGTNDLVDNKQIQTKCGTCNVFLHMSTSQESDAPTSCFELWHTTEHLSHLKA